MAGVRPEADLTGVRPEAGMTGTVTASLIPADGTDLYAERRGSGPPVLLIPGGGGDCGLFGELAELLAEAGYTVLSYDRRGNSRSRLHQPPVPITISGQSDDAAAVLRASGLAPAVIFGSSGGANIALELTARQPRLVTAVVAHEPPVPRVLPESDRHLAAYAEIDRILLAEGWEPAFWRFQEFIGRVPAATRPAGATGSTVPVTTGSAGTTGRRPAQPRPVRLDLERMKRLHGNWEYLMRFEMQPFIRYLPDTGRIAASRIPVAVAVGADTIALAGRVDPAGPRYDPVGQCTVVAARLGTRVTEFPGGHFAPTELPGPFAARLARLLSELGAAPADLAGRGSGAGRGGQPGPEAAGLGTAPP